MVRCKLYSGVIRDILFTKRYENRKVRWAGLQPRSCAVWPIREFKNTDINRPVSGMVTDGDLVGLLALEDRLFYPIYGGLDPLICFTFSIP